jgi:hypothetical protein
MESGWEISLGLMSEGNVPRNDDTVKKKLDSDQNEIAEPQFRTGKSCFGLPRECNLLPGRGGTNRCAAFHDDLSGKSRVGNFMFILG